MTETTNNDTPRSGAPGRSDRPQGGRSYGGGGGGGGSDRRRDSRDSRDSRDGGGFGGRREGGGGRPRPRRRGKVCRLCVDKVNYVDYKDLKRLRDCLTNNGKILPRRITGACARHQRMLTTAVKRARLMALIPYKTN